MAKLDHTRRVLKYELLGLFLLVLGIVTLGDLGAVGQALDDLCIMVAGNWHFLVPLYLVWVALFVMIKRHRFRYTQMQIGLLILLFVTVTWSELDLYTQAAAQLGPDPNLLHITQVGITSLTQSLQVLIVSPSGSTLPPADAGGGMLGYALFAGLKYLFSVVGTLLVMIAFLLAALVLMTRKSLVGFIENGSRYFERRFDRGWTGLMRSLARHARGSAPGGHGVEPGKGPRSKARKAVPAQESDDHGDRQWEEGSEASLLSEASSDKPQRVSKPSRRKRKTHIPDEAPTFDTAPVQVQENVFPFPDFGVPYDSEPPFEDFFEEANGNSGADSEMDVQATRESNNASETQVDFDESKGRMSFRLPKEEAKPLAPDPLPVVLAQATRNEPGDATEHPAAVTAVRPYRVPDVRILDRGGGQRGDAAAAQRELQQNARKLAETFASFGVEVKVVGYSRGPAVTRYEIQPAVGVKVSRIVSLSDDLALALAARDIRIEAPIPGKSAIGIEVPNKEIAVVTFREVLETDTFSNAKSLLTIALGKDIAGNTIVGDLARMPHILVAGATGSGKSVCINGIIASILFRARPDQVKFILIDPKMVELGVYNGIPHLFAPVVTEARRAAAALRKVIAEMEHRYELFSKAKVRDLERYNAYAVANDKSPLPLIVVIIDELADLMMVAPGDVETAICRLAQMARASGIHLVVATQRPSVDVITGLIKSNIPSRIAFSVSSGVDSRTILDGSGAEKLLGRGDMLYMPVGASKPLRIQGAFLSELEVEKLVEFTRRQQEAEYLDDFSVLPDESGSGGAEDLDPLFEEAVKLVVESEQASTSFLQRKLKVGYARAARLVDSLEQMGIVGAFDNSKPREVYMTREQWLERQSSSSSLG